MRTRTDNDLLNNWDSDRSFTRIDQPLVIADDLCLEFFALCRPGGIKPMYRGSRLLSTNCMAAKSWNECAMSRRGEFYFALRYMFRTSGQCSYFHKLTDGWSDDKSLDQADFVVIAVKSDLTQFVVLPWAYRWYDVPELFKVAIGKVIQRTI